jgi:NifU-like protein involved in Fe-S cluster formation
MPSFQIARCGDESGVMLSTRFLDHLYSPRHRGPLALANSTRVCSIPRTGDQMYLMLRVQDGQVLKASFLACGSPQVLAAASAGTALVQGNTVAEAWCVDASDLEQALGGAIPVGLRQGIQMFMMCLGEALGPFASAEDDEEAIC